MPRPCSLSTIAAWMVTAGSAAAAPAPPPLPGATSGFEAGRRRHHGGWSAEGGSPSVTSTATCTPTSPPRTVLTPSTPAYGNGFGGFTTGHAVGVGDDPYGIVVADLDGDGRGDIATADRGDDTVTVLIQDEGGAFNALEPIPSRGNRRS